MTSEFPRFAAPAARAARLRESGAGARTPASDRAGVRGRAPGDRGGAMKVLKGTLAALVFAAFPMVASAQYADGRISGSVRDSSNALVAGATVTVRNEKTGEVRTVQSNDQGR